MPYATPQLQVSKEDKTGKRAYPYSSLQANCSPVSNRFSRKATGQAMRTSEALVGPARQ
jgi:hypothetical protein